MLVSTLTSLKTNFVGIIVVQTDSSILFPNILLSDNSLNLFICSLLHRIVSAAVANTLATKNDKIGPYWL